MPWIVSYFSTALGLGLVLLHGLALIVPAVIFLAAFDAGSDYSAIVWLGYILVLPAAVIWLWFCWRFFLPVIFEIAKRGWKGLFGIAYLTPHHVRQIVRDGRQVLWSDVDNVYGRWKKLESNND